MKQATLVVLAAGLGSRFGKGIKQLTPVGPNGELIIDYSVQDALAAGFDQVIFIIRRDLEADFRRLIGDRISSQMEVRYVYQEISDVPEDFQGAFPNRKRPWGTGQALLCLQGKVHNPFLVINADDYYGQEAYRHAYRYLTGEQAKEGPMQACMVGYTLKNTLSENGGVNRAVCEVSADGFLEGIYETYDIQEKDGKVVTSLKGKEWQIPENAIVSMNMWGLYPAFLDVLQTGFAEFLTSLDPKDVESEYLLADIIQEQLREQQLQVKVLPSGDAWFGVTFQEDQASVARAIQAMTEKGKSRH